MTILSIRIYNIKSKSLEKKIIKNKSTLRFYVGSCKSVSTHLLSVKQKLKKNHVRESGGADSFLWFCRLPGLLLRLFFDPLRILVSKSKGKHVY